MSAEKVHGCEEEDRCSDIHKGIDTEHQWSVLILTRKSGAMLHTPSNAGFRTNF
jgi:hypothetical protein